MFSVFGKDVIDRSFLFLCLLILLPASVFGQVPPGEVPVFPGSLKDAPLPAIVGIERYIKDNAAAVRLGKALFWDMQTGSDGLVACASCHFHAGADGRAANQLHPGPNGGFDFGAAPNSTPAADVFPFRKLARRDDRNSLQLSDRDEIMGSHGVFKATYVGYDPDLDAGARERGTLVADPIFNVGGKNIRQVTGRNSPSVLNAAYNLHNFWDGRANRIFNGITPFGAGGEAGAGAILVAQLDGSLLPETVSLDLASLASQAVGPALSATEMSYDGRTFPLLGRKMLGLTPLAKQVVHPRDGVLGGLSASPAAGLRRAGGSAPSYADLVKDAFQDAYWNSPLSTAGGFSQMENNFSLFFGLAVQAYERTLISDDAKFDRFREGKTALTAQEQLGMEIFFDMGRFDGQFDRPSGGRCHFCHRGPEFTSISARQQLVEQEFKEIMLMKDGASKYYDGGFYNIALRPTEEDLGRGGLDPLGRPLATSRIDLGPGLEEFIAVDGSFKTPSLRNVELTGPYFHTGSMSTLMQVIDFYARGGDFVTHNLPMMSPLIGPDAPGGVIAVLVNNEVNKRALVAFLLTLTDERVRFERAPFDHPQLFVAGGEPGGSVAVNCTDELILAGACSELIELPAVGADGRSRAQPLATFLSLDPFSPLTGVLGVPNGTFRAGHVPLHILLGQ